MREKLIANNATHTTEWNQSFAKQPQILVWIVWAVGVHKGEREKANQDVFTGTDNETHTHTHKTTT